MFGVQSEMQLAVCCHKLSIFEIWGDFLYYHTLWFRTKLQVCSYLCVWRLGDELPCVQVAVTVETQMTCML